MKKWFVIHPLLFAIFPILFLFSHNIKEMSFSDTFRPIVIVVSFALLLWLLLSLVTRNLQRAAIITSIFLLLFFSYGHLLDCIPDILEDIAHFHYFVFAVFPILPLFSPHIKEMSSTEIVLSTAIATCFTFLLWTLLTFFLKNKRKSAIITALVVLSIFWYGHLLKRVLVILIGLHLNESYVVSLLALVFVGSAFLVIKTRRKLDKLTQYLNIVSILLVAFPTITIMVHWIGSRDYPIREGQVVTVNLEKSNKLPDIYYIIVDGYARADILKEFYQYDNSKFLKYLSQRGFYVANKSSANYCQTLLSLASSLNLVHLNNLAQQIGAESNNKRPLMEMIKNNEVAKFLKEHGYLFVVFTTGVCEKMMGANADLHMLPKGSLGEFENLLLNTTPIPLLLNKLPEKSQCDLHRDGLLYAFDHLADKAKLDTPVYVFAHILAPHRPFVFGQNGEKAVSDKEFSFGHATESLDKDEYRESYRNQLIFINKKIQAAIDEIISNSPNPPLIILQADHGSGLHWFPLDEHTFNERMPILNAYYLPDSGHKKLYEEITPVNTFRIIFNHYFGTNLELLEDKCYLSTWEHPYKFIDVNGETNTD